MPSCYELGETAGAEALSPVAEEAAMPWKGLGQQPTLQMISIGKDTSGSLYSKKELKAVMDAVMDKGSLPIYFVVPRAKNWASWDAALFLRSEKEEEKEVHIVLLQLTLDPNHKIYAKGLNQVRDAAGKNEEGGEGPSVHYHYVVVLLVEDEQKQQIPKWRHVLIDSKGRQEDTSWRRDNLRQYIMFVPFKELR
jgi:hypothetical protein